jgi:hypothetical protein
VKFSEERRRRNERRRTLESQWVRGNEHISFTRPHPHLFFCQGIRGSEKSSFMEMAGCYYLDKGHTISDLFSSRDGENLAWLRSPFSKEKKILLLCGELMCRRLAT